MEFIEIDPDLLAAAASGSQPAATGPAETADAASIDTWLATWTREDMAALVKAIALGKAQEAEREVRSGFAAWQKAQRPRLASTAPRRTVAHLYALAEVASGVRLQREAEDHAAEEAESRREREAALRQLLADADKHWAAADAQARRGSASGYEQAVRTLANLAEAYTLTSSRDAFDSALRRLLVRHATRAALLRRLGEAGLL